MILGYYNTLIYSSYRKLFYNDNPNIPTKNTTYKSGGYIKNKLKKYNNFKKISNKSIKYQEEHFKSLIKFCEQNKRKLLVIKTPVTKERRKNILNLKYYDSIIRSIYPNYMDFNINTNLIDSIHFQDDAHLNYLGAEKFNKRIIDSLKALRLIN